MLIFDLREIGNRLFIVRKRNGLTQAEVAEGAGLSDRTYADIERGTVNMRVETLLKICGTLHISPDDVLVNDSEDEPNEAEIMEHLSCCRVEDRKTALKLLAVYLNSLR